MGERKDEKNCSCYYVDAKEHWFFSRDTLTNWLITLNKRVCGSITEIDKMQRSVFVRHGRNLKLFKYVHVFAICQTVGMHL